MTPPTCLRDRPAGRDGTLCDATADVTLVRYHVPTRHKKTMPTSAARENDAMLPWPRGTARKAASRGPSDEPALPPTWKNDCANPCRPPDASRAMRDDSRWQTADPSPTNAA